MQNLNQRYRRNDNYVYRKIEHETILVPIKDNVGDMACIYNLNEVGAFVWEYLDEKKTLDQIIKMVTEEFEVSIHDAETDLCEFIDDLKEIDAIHQ